MKRLSLPLAALLLATFLAACSSAPAKPQSVEKFERAMARGAERYQAGELPAARDQFLQAVRAAELDDSAQRRAQALLSVGAVSALLEDDTQAHAAYAESLKEATRANDQRGTALARLGLANGARRKGNVSGALQVYQEVLGAPGVIDASERMLAENGLALAYAANQRAAEGQALLARLEQQGRASNPAALSSTLSNQAALLLADKQAQAALKPALEALDLDRATHHPPSIAASHMRLAEIYAAMAHWSAARDAADRAERIFTYTGQKPALARLQALRQRWPQQP